MNERQCGYQDRSSEEKRGYTATPHKTIRDILRCFGHTVFKNGTKKRDLEANVGLQVGGGGLPIRLPRS